MTTNSFQIDSNSMKTRQELVTDAIRLAILHGRFHPGDRIDQKEIADELGVSRSPVREAIRVLTTEDLLTYYRHRGTIVTERSADELAELTFMRQLLEGAAAKRAAEVITDERIQNLKDMITEARTSTDLEHLLLLNNTFHKYIYESFEQPILLGEIQKFRNKVAPYNRLYLDYEGQKKAAWDDHVKIFEACVARDGNAAEQETKNHLQRVLEVIIDVIG